MRADYHLHSEFSDDSHTLMEDQILAAVNRQMDEICFTDHVDYGIKKDWDEEGIEYRPGDGVGTSVDSLEPITNVDYPKYFAKLAQMKEQFKTQITIKSGLEFGIQMGTIDRYKTLLEKYGDQLDFILLSFHQVDNQEFWNGDFIKGKTQDQFYQRYYKEMLDVVSVFDDYDCLAHVDLISRYDSEGPYPFEKVKDRLSEIFRIVIYKGKGIEINTSSWHYGLKDTTPAKDILKLYHSLGGRIITIGSDAHTPDYVADHYEDARTILKEIGFTEFYTFDKHQPKAHQL